MLSCAVRRRNEERREKNENRRRGAISRISPKSIAQASLEPHSGVQNS
jgi:hypothetical protein